MTQEITRRIKPRNQLVEIDSNTGPKEVRIEQNGEGDIINSKKKEPLLFVTISKIKPRELELDPTQRLIALLG